MSHSSTRNSEKTGRAQIPGMNLQEAVDKTLAIWNKFKRRPLRAELAGDLWNYRAASSGRRMTLAALRLFGLVGHVGHKKSGQIKVSELGAWILEDPDRHPFECRRALKKAALRPALYRELWNASRGQLVGPESLHDYLTDQKKLPPKSVRALVKDFVDTIEFAELTPSDFSIAPWSPNVSQTQNQLVAIDVAENRIALPEGSVILQCPKRMSAASQSIYVRFLKVMIQAVEQADPVTTASYPEKPVATASSPEKPQPRRRIVNLRAHAEIPTASSQAPPGPEGKTPG